MFRRSPQAESEPKAATAAPAVNTIEALLKPAEWDRLSDADRAQLSALFPALSVTAGRSEPLLRAGAPAPLQDWIAAVVGHSFQSYVAASVRSWLDTTPETAHLYVGGDLAIGAPQLIASVARQRAASWPTPSSYCFAPDPTALDQPMLLALPLGTGVVFTKALAEALGALSKQWDASASRQQALNQIFDDLAGGAPAAGQDYLNRLRTALLQLAMTGAAFPWDGDNGPPLGTVTPEPQVTSGAPVVEATALDSTLTDVLLQANGGVLIVSPGTVDLDKLLSALVSRQLSLDDSLPPVPLSVRVVLLGTDQAYDALWSNSDLIGQIFRYEAWSQDITPWNRDAEAAYAAYAAGVAHYYALPAPAPDAVGRLIQEGSRRADSLLRSRLSTDLLMLHDIIFEAGKLAQARSSPMIAAEDIDAALDRRRALQQANVYWVQEAILTGESITPTAGSAVGQINGLGVLEVHPWEGTFAVPMRISATVAPGKGEQLLDVEREVKQADESHVRGLLTMEGYFASQYGQKVPLSLAARVRFEQEQGSIGGDSASAAELLALLSALANAPIRRSVAVTGALGQYGELQPIGGVNFKIEGFWDLCRARRKLGETENSYGVVIPAPDTRDLMLRASIAAAIVSEGWFHVWPVKTIDEAIPLLMGLPAATVHDRVERRLREFAQVESQQKRGR
jgi:hypothetical protein